MRYVVSKLLLVFALVVGSTATNENPEVVTTLGRIKGSLMSTRLNKTIYAFRGVRYGQSTEGERRFKQAVPVEPWAGTFDATQEGPACPSYEALTISSEDCLRLNVYANKLPSCKDKVKRPVIVFFHPGAYYAFTAQSLVFGPQYYLDKDIVLVTVNYRLATLGFIATGDARAPGNLGMKDQVAALRWIKKNIAAFGGDPDNVTITGYSVGAWSVIFHLLSPMSRGLFHRIIAMSGAPTGAELLPTEQKDLALKQAGFVNCPSDNLDAAFECLKKVDFKALALSLPKFKEFLDRDPVFIWMPVVEPEIPGVERFITDQPVNLLRKKRFQHVPVIVGITKDEFASGVLPAIEAAKKGDDSIFRNYTENWEYAAPIAFMYERNTTRSKCISQEFRKYYLKDQPITLQNAKKFGQIYADAIIGYSTHRFAQLISQNSRAPVYYYKFTYQSRFSFATWSDTKKPYGVVHHDDLQYLFYISIIFPFFKPTDPEVAMVDKLTSMWVSFAQCGRPLPLNDPRFKGVKWTTLKPRKQNYLEIGEKLTMKQGLYSERYAVWDRLFPLPPLH